MNIAAFYHRSVDNWCYPLDATTLHVRVQTAANDAEAVDLVIGDPYHWKDGRWLPTTVPLVKEGCDGLHDLWGTAWVAPWKRAKYYFVVKGGTEAWVYGERGILPAADTAQEYHRNAFLFPYINEVDRFQAPVWVKDTVWYQVFPERFANGEPRLNPTGTKPWATGPVTNKEFYGGDLPGLRSRLGHLAELGVTGLYLTPVFESPSVHKYDTTDYLKVDPAFGTTEDLKAVVADAHTQGIRVLFDAVFNHAGGRFAPWLDVVEKGRASAYAEWFHVDDEGTFETFAFAKNMPKLNTAHPAVRDYLIGAAVHWMRETGVDGWRLDVANEVDHDFWRAFRKAVKAVNPEAYIVGEVWHDSLRWLRGDQYDAVMNYRYGVAVSDFITGKNRVTTAAAFTHAIDAIDAAYPLTVLRSAFNVLDSHDTDRFLNRCGGDTARARQGWLLLFLLKGSPCVYYGDEFGLPGADDPDNRRCMLWDESSQDRGLYAFFKALVAFRREAADLITFGAREWLTDPDRPLVLGLRISHTGRTLEAWVHRSAEPAGWSPSPGEVILDHRGPWGYRLQWC